MTGRGGSSRSTSNAGSVGWYTPIDPPRDLHGLLACAWTAVPTGRHRLTPDSCIDLLRLSSGEVILCGPETVSWQFELAEYFPTFPDMSDPYKTDDWFPSSMAR